MSELIAPCFASFQIIACVLIILVPFGVHPLKAISTLWYHFFTALAK
jgi:ABC-type uncharacterized transport system permease subunit